MYSWTVPVNEKVENEEEPKDAMQGSGAGVAVGVGELVLLGVVLAVREAVMEGDAPTDKLGVGEALSVPLALLVAVTDVV